MLGLPCEITCQPPGTRVNQGAPSHRLRWPLTGESSRAGPIPSANSPQPSLPAALWAPPPRAVCKAHR